LDTALIVALIGVGGTLLASVLAQIIINRREAARLEHEREQKELELKEQRELKQSELEHERHENRREERLKAYQAFYNAARVNMQIRLRLSTVEASQRSDMVRTETDRLMMSHAEVILLAPADVIWSADLIGKAVGQLGGQKTLSEDDRKTMNHLLITFVGAVRADLDIEGGKELWRTGGRRLPTPLKARTGVPMAQRRGSGMAGPTLYRQGALRGLWR
jgi:hypothetical protein